MTTQLEIDWQAKAARASGRDITANRHGGNAESEAAFRRVGMHLTQARAAVLQAVQNAPQGLTCKELAEAWDCGQNAISGRFSELLQAGLIERTGERRDGSAVVKIA